MEINAHSDFLVHWTGKDIEEDIEKQKKLSPEEKNIEYLKRFKSILKYGLWMKKPAKRTIIKINDKKFKKPDIARISFTELKLSITEDHSHLYGKLGIGVKKYFLFNRLGSPIHYCQPGTHNLFFAPYSNFLETTPEILSFFKHMCSKHKKRSLKYDLYNESEWRIIFSENIRKSLLKNNNKKAAKLFVNPKTIDYFNSIKNKPEYLLPLDSWLGLIIYPNLEVKKRAIKDVEIRNLLKKISARGRRNSPEKNCMPIELDLGACKQF